MNDLDLIVHNALQLIGLLIGCLALRERCLHLLQAGDGLVQVRLHQLIFSLLDFQAVAVAPHQEGESQCSQCQQRHSQQGAFEA